MNWHQAFELAIRIVPAGSFVLTACGLMLTGVGLIRQAKVAQNTFMLNFYDHVQKFNKIDLYLKHGWPNGQIGPTSPDEWMELRRYMGLFEGLWRMIQDGAYPIDRADGDYSHRILALVMNEEVIKECIKKEPFAWRDFIGLWRELETLDVYKGLAKGYESEGLVVPRPPGIYEIAAKAKQA